MLNENSIRNPRPGRVRRLPPGRPGGKSRPAARRRRQGRQPQHRESRRVDPRRRQGQELASHQLPSRGARGGYISAMRSIAENQRPAPGELYLDHVAHFVPDLGAAARVAESLGFKVTPESAHHAQGAPAGTSNRTIMLEEGYIEILAPTLDTPNARRVQDHMARYRGGHPARFGTPDAESEHRRLAAHGFEPEPVVSLE